MAPGIERGLVLSTICGTFLMKKIETRRRGRREVYYFILTWKASYADPLQPTNLCLHILVTLGDAINPTQIIKKPSLWP